MKSLYESILSSTKSGKLALIKNWCEENQPFAGNWEITKDYEIACTNRGGSLILKFDTFSELPDYMFLEHESSRRDCLYSEFTTYQEKWQMVSFQKQTIDSYYLEVKNK